MNETSLLKKEINKKKAKTFKIDMRLNGLFRNNSFVHLSFASAINWEYFIEKIYKSLLYRFQCFFTINNTLDIN